MGSSDNEDFLKFIFIFPKLRKYMTSRIDALLYILAPDSTWYKD